MEKLSGIICILKRKNNWAVAALLLLWSLVSCTSRIPGDAHDTGSYPLLFPEIQEVTVPFNIAPLNFRLNEECAAMTVVFEGDAGGFEQSVKGQELRIDPEKWAAMLRENAGSTIHIQVYAQQEGSWKKYLPVPFFVAKEPVDEYLLYRLIMPGYQTWNTMGIYQRKLSGFSAEPILNSRLMPFTCMNCHSMANNNPDHMLIHLRENNAGTILIRDGRVEKLQTKTKETFGSVSFPSWHPSAAYIAFSINKIRQLFPSRETERAHAFDMESDMVIYDVEKKEFFTSPLLFSPGAYEAFPCFSPDGTRLFFVTTNAVPMPDSIGHERYSLCSIAFDALTGKIGNRVDTLIAASAVGKSVTMPRISPDGKYLVVTTADHGNFPAYFREADLALYSFADSSLVPADILNSDDVESYHSWSSNGRWMVFSSRRMDGLHMNLYLTYMDPNGRFHKPFLLPQEDPGFHDTFLFSFNLPEFAIRKADVSPYSIERVAKKSKGEQVQFDTSH